MKTLHTRALLAVQLAILALWLSPGARADDSAVPPPLDSAPPVKATALGVRQEHVKRMMSDLDQKFVDLARTLEKTEPAQAKRLVDALQQSKQLLIENRMAKIGQLLNETRLDHATDEQKRVVADLKRLIKILLEDDKDLDKLQEEANRLQRWSAEIDRLIREETDEKRESEKVSDKDQTLSKLAEQIAALEELIKKEREVIDHTEKTRSEGIQGLHKVADEQRQVRSETQKLAQEIGLPRAGDNPAAPARAGQRGNPQDGADGKSSDGKSSDGKSSDGKSSDGKVSDGKSTDGKSSDGKSSDGKASDSAGGDGGDGQSGSGDASGSSGGSPSGAEAGQKPLERAVKHQEGAEGSLDQGKGKAAEQDEHAALADLNQALAELKKEKSRIASLPPEAFDQMAQAQDQTADKTAGLGEEMSKAGDQGGQSGDGQSGDGQSGDGQSGDGQSGGNQAGQKKVESAQKSMRQASGNLKKKDPKKATPPQRKAIQDLKDAKEELEERLAQLRREMQIEKLAALEARFREMLERQKPLTAGTPILDKNRVDGKLRRADRLALVKLADEEKAIGVMAELALEIIVEDGTSVVFPQIVAELRDDLRSAEDLLRGEKTDSYTQHLQQDIERTLIELIDALQKAQENLESQGQSDSDDSNADDNEPLLPNSAELKLLKAAQLRVNNRTTAFETARPLGELEEVLKQEIRNIAKRQAEVERMTEQMSERN